jgi:hypothetical protein
VRYHVNSGFREVAPRDGLDCLKFVILYSIYVYAGRELFTRLRTTEACRPQGKV